MRVGTLLQQATSRLQTAGIATARLDVLVLLEDLLNIDRARLLAHPEIELSSKQQTIIDGQLNTREQHTPLAYIRGKASFYGRTFQVSPAVLVPRPESEAIIELLLTLDLPSEPCIGDIGTGSGCLGITAALEIPQADIWLYDIDETALAIAAKNASTHQVRVHSTRQDLLTNASAPFDVLLANLPYVPTAYPINTAARHEPKIALFAGDDGLELFRIFWEQLVALQHQPSYVLTESLLIQHDDIAQLAAAAGYTLQATSGLIQQFAASDRL